MTTPDLNQILKQAQEMQKKLQAAQEEVAKLEVTGESGAGLIKVTMDGKHNVTKVTIDDEVLQEDKEILEDLIAAATNDAVKKVEAGSQSKMSGLTAGMDLPTDFNPFK